MGSPWRPDTTGYVYFIQMASGPIKIGFSDDPMRRFQTFQIAHYEEMRLLGVIPGKIGDEKRIQREVRASLIRGEWYHPTDEVRAYLSKLVPSPPAQQHSPLSRHKAVPVERGAIERAIEQTKRVDPRGNLSHAASLLGCSRRTLQNRMRALGMPVGEPGRRHKLVYLRESDTDQ